MNKFGIKITKKISKIFLLFAFIFCFVTIFSGCGSVGPKGEDGNVWIIQESAPTKQTSGKTGDMFLNSKNYDLYRKTDYGWLFIGNIKGANGQDGVDGDRGWKGESGDEVQLQVSDNNVQWKYKNSDVWIDLIALSLLKGSSGENARNVEFTTTKTHIQWRYIANENENQEDFQWQPLIEISALQGTVGKDGKSAYEIALKNGFKGTELEWLNSLKGTNGATWHVEEIAPTPEYSANEGDLYLNTSNYDIFKLTAGNWGKIGNIKSSSPTIEINNKGYWVINGEETEVLADQSKAEVVGEILAYNYLDKSDLEGKKITFLGDSITFGANLTDKDSSSYVSLIKSILNVEVENLGINGTSFCEGLVDKDFVTATSRYIDVKNYNKETDYFVVQLGVNDWSRSETSNLQLGAIGTNNLNTFYGAVNVYAKTLKQKFEGTNTKIIFLTPTVCRAVVGTYDSNVNNKLGYSLRDMCNAIIETANLYDIQVLDLNLESGIYYRTESDNNVSLYLKDGLHPNEEGHALIANKLIDFIQNNFEYVERSKAKIVNLSYYVDTVSAFKNHVNKVVSGGKYKVPELFKERSGYTFKYWTDSNENIYYPGDVITINSNLTLNAKYAQNIAVTLVHNFGQEKVTETQSLGFSNSVDKDTNKLITNPISSMDINSSYYGLVPTLYLDEGLTTKLSGNETFLENENPVIYVDWETDVNWFKIEDNVITGRGDNFPKNYSEDEKIIKLIFPKFNNNGDRITGLNLSSSMEFFLNQTTYVSSVNTIGANVFKNTEVIYFPEGYNSILGSYFLTVRGSLDTGNFTTINIFIPSTLTNITESAFANLQNVKFIISAENTAYSSNDYNMWLNKSGDKLIRYVDVYIGDEVNSSYEMPNDVTTIGAYSFYGNKKLTEITLSQNLITQIGQNNLAFMNNLTKITITKNLSEDGLTGIKTFSALNKSFAQMEQFRKNGSIYVMDDNDKTYLTSILNSESTYTSLIERISVISQDAE